MYIISQVKYTCKLNLCCWYSSHLLKHFRSFTYSNIMMDASSLHTESRQASINSLRGTIYAGKNISRQNTASIKYLFNNFGTAQIYAEAEPHATTQTSRDDRDKSEPTNIDQANSPFSKDINSLGNLYNSLLLEVWIKICLKLSSSKMTDHDYLVHSNLAILTS